MKLRLLIVLLLVVVLVGLAPVRNSYASSANYSPCCANCCYTTHVVKQGEYLKLIAARYGTTVDAILCCNNIRNPNLIYPGQRLRIPYPCTAAGPWKGQFWNNRNLSGSPKFTRNYKSVSFNWGSGAVGSGVGSDNFSARFASTQKFAAANYRFHLEVDDGVRLFIDGQLVIDQWRVTSVAHYTADRQMTAGNHTLRIDYYEQSGLARIRFWMERVAVPSPTMWTAEYFSNRSLTAPPVLTRTETHAIDYDWGGGSPVAALPADNFSVRWVRNVNFEAGTYRFTVEADDGVVVRIDGTPIIDQWHDAGNKAYVKDVYLAKGVHEVRVRYYEATGAAKIKLSWAKVPPAAWTAKYFNNTNLEGNPVLTRSDAAINFNWGNKSPATVVAADQFSAVWNGDFSFSAGTYRFTATADDGIRVYLDGNLIIDEWHVTSVRTYWAELYVPAGTHHVRVRYFENNGLAVAKVSWVKK
ncbi:MAG: LysM peptidoglycan-binding domain-containing protein [Anaerolineae bacterium]|nr:LysM peptidoglycan-binding domain-containing protein [Anaerolineae bacterium]